MRSESEIQWIRVKNNISQTTKVSDWHAIIPGYGSMSVPPGTACGVGLSGSRQMAQNSAIRTMDGTKHDECMRMASDFVAGIDPSPGPRVPDAPNIKLAPPGTTIP